jgi:hypothetical protein
VGEQREPRAHTRINEKESVPLVGGSLRVPAASARRGSDRARSVPRTRTFRSVRSCVPATGTFRRLVQERLGRDAGAGQARGHGRVRAGGHSDPVHHRRHDRQGSRLGRGWVELSGRLHSHGGGRLRRRAHKARRPPVLRPPEGPEWAKNGRPGRSRREDRGSRFYRAGAGGNAGALRATPAPGLVQGRLARRRSFLCRQWGHEPFSFAASAR